jgi:hypothetical protein
MLISMVAFDYHHRRVSGSHHDMLLVAAKIDPVQSLYFHLGNKSSNDYYGLFSI